MPVPGACPCSLFDDSVTPGIAELREGVPLTLGVRFSSVSAGEVLGIRFYKSAGNTGTHNGALYSAAGQQLATVAFTNESASGWQTAMFSQPVQMAANTDYIVSYKSLTGTYSATANGFGSGMSVGPLRAASDAGAYTYSGDFASARSTTSYLVDVVVNVPERAVHCRLTLAAAQRGQCPPELCGQRSAFRGSGRLQRHTGGQGHRRSCGGRVHHLRLKPPARSRSPLLPR